MVKLLIDFLTLALSSLFPSRSYSCSLFSLLFLTLSLSSLFISRSYSFSLRCANGTPDVVKLLIDCGAEVNARDKMGSAALHYAVKTSQEEAARMLIQSADAHGDLNWIKWQTKSNFI